MAPSAQSTASQRVPLRLSGAVLYELATFEGAGEHVLHFEPDGEGYVRISLSTPDHRLVEAFVRADALQCGFCTPGQIVSAAALVASGAEEGYFEKHDEKGYRTLVKKLDLKK